MKTRSLAPALILTLAAAGAAQAQEGTQDFAGQTLSTRTRAEVIAELQQARAAGRLDQPGALYGSFDATQLVSTRTRADVRADLAASGPLSRGDHGG